MTEEEKKQYEEADVIMAVTDEDGTKHYIYGDKFAHFALMDVFQKIQNVN